MKVRAILFSLLFAAGAVFSACGGESGGGASGPTATAAPVMGQDDAVGADAADGGSDDDFAAAAEENWQTKDYTGTVVKFIGSESYMFVANKINWGHAFYMAILEWQELTGGKVDMLPALEIPAVLSGIAANEGYDLIHPGAYYAMNDYNEYLDEYIPYFAGRYGSKYFDLQGACVYNGRHIAMLWPWYFGSTAMLYNAELLTRLGVERPAQLFMRGEWTWDAYWDIVRYVGQLDLDGDGEPDFVATANNPHFSYMVSVYEELADGTYVNRADTQKLRDFAEMIYNGYNIYDIYQEEMPQPWNYYAFSSDRYPWICSVSLPAYDPTCFFGFIDNVGEMLEWVPIPAYGDGSEFDTSISGISLLKGCQNLDGSLNFIDFAINAVGDSAMQMVTRGRKDYGFVGMTGRTAESADYLEWWANFIETDYARFENSPYYDWDYYEACLEYWNNLPMLAQSMHGWRRSYFYPPEWQIFRDNPPATAVAIYVEQLQTLIDEHNATIPER